MGILSRLGLRLLTVESGTGWEYAGLIYVLHREQDSEVSQHSQKKMYKDAGGIEVKYAHDRNVCPTLMNVLLTQVSLGISRKKVCLILILAENVSSVMSVKQILP